MKIIFVHHGNRNRGTVPSQDDDLTEIGIKDCEIVNELLIASNMKVSAIYSSKFFRCTKTANIISQNLNIPTIIDERLDEFKSVDGETWTQLQERVIACIDEIILKHNGDEVVICVTSGLSLGAFMCKAFGIAPSENTPYLGVPSCSPIIFNF